MLTHPCSQAVVGGDGRLASSSHGSYGSALLLLAAVLISSMLAACEADAIGSIPANVILVNAAASGADDGSSWANAFTTVQAAVGAALPGEQVWVAEGVYVADAPGAAVLIMADDVAVYGSFLGQEFSVAGRAGSRTNTILSGDYDASGTATAGDSDSVVEGASNARLDGFTVSGGNGSTGGGMLNIAVSNLTVANVDFTGNFATEGGGMYNQLSDLTLNQVNFSDNAANLGGGMRNHNSSNPTLDQVAFSGNTAILGGGMYNTFESNPTLNQVTFSDNIADNAGGGMCNEDSSPTLTLITFVGNLANGIGGGGMFNLNANPTLTRIGFAANTGSEGGGMHNNSSAPVLSQVVFSRNVGRTGGGIYNNGSNPTLTRTVFSANSADWGGGIYNTGSSPQLTRVVFTDNVAANDGGGIYNDSGSGPELIQTAFSANSAANGGGIYGSGSSPNLTQVTFAANSADWGGGMFNSGISTPALSQVTFFANSATQAGGGIYNSSGADATLAQSTFTTNVASFGGGMFNEVSSPSIVNSAFWGNSGVGMDVYSDGDPFTITNSCSQTNFTSLSATNVTLGADPFTAILLSGEVYLNTAGGCVDIGNATAPGTLTTAFDGALDTGVVDAGRAYFPEQPLILSLSTSGTTLSWTTRNASACTVLNDQDATWITVPAGQLPNGSVSHGRSTGAVLVLACNSSAGSPAVGRATVP